MIDGIGLSGGGGTPNLTTGKPIQNPILPKPVNRPTKLGIDAHEWFYVARQLDGATPQPVQRMNFDGLLRFVAKQQGLAREVLTCYESSGAR